MRLPLLVNGDHRHRTIVDKEGGKPSETEIHLLEDFGAYAPVKAILHSGRTHQIRTHLAAISFPLIADGQYGDGKPLLAQTVVGDRPLPGLQRLGLQARSLELAHPLTTQSLKVKAPYPPDFSQSLAHLHSIC